MSTVETTLPSHTEIEDAIEQAGKRIMELAFLPSYTIEDYPIGRRDRGKCELRVEFKKGKGWRTWRATTNKRGQWCKPKCSTYDRMPIAVVTAEDLQRDCAWLRMSSWGKQVVYLQAANGDLEETILSMPEGLPSFAPRREAHKYRIKTTTLYENTVSYQDCEDTADPPEVCDAWDVWAAGLASLVELVRSRA